MPTAAASASVMGNDFGMKPGSTARSGQSGVLIAVLPTATRSAPSPKANSTSLATLTPPQAISAIWAGMTFLKRWRSVYWLLGYFQVVAPTFGAEI